MKVKLNKRELFWSLINPRDLEDILVVLNESNPEVDINYEKLPKWAQDQIDSSAKSGKIDLESGVKVASNEETQEKPKPAAPSKKVSKKVAKSAE